jgi:hypothetical protein
VNYNINMAVIMIFPHQCSKDCSVVQKEDFVVLGLILKNVTISANCIVVINKN